MRILVVQTAFLGDVVLTTPLLRELKRAHPAGRLDVLTTETGARILAGLPGIDGLHPLDKRWNLAGLRSSFGALRALQKLRPDIAVAAQRSTRTGLLIRLSGAPLRVGFAGAPGAWAYDRWVPWEPERHAVRRYLDLSGPVGGQPQTADTQPRITVPPQAHGGAAQLLSRKGIGLSEQLLCVAPGSHWPTKRWTVEGYAAVVSAAERLGLRVALVGTKAERSLCDRVAAHAGGRATVVAGETGVQELAALLARARAVVGNDSGVGHLASAVGTSVVSVFGPTVPEQGYAPIGSRVELVQHEGLACRPCGRHGGRRCPLGHFRCMREIPETLVVDRIVAVLSAASDQDQRLPLAAG